MNYLTKAEREELSNLSKETLGRRSAWQKILAEGILVPNNEPGIKSQRVHRPSLDEIKTHLLELKKQMDEQKSKQEQTKESEGT